MKKLLGLLILLGLFALMVLVAAHFFLGHAAKFALERTLPQFTKTPVAIESVSLSPFFGRAEVKGFALGNPEGFSSEHAIKLRALRIDFQPRTLWQPTFIINRIELLGPEFTLEGRGSNQNLAVLLNTLQERTQSRRKPAPTDETTEATESRFIIRQLVIDQGSLRILMGGVPLAMQLQRMEFENLRGGGGTSQQLDIQEILNKVLKTSPNL